MTPERKDALLHKLSANRAALLALCTDLTDAQWHARAFGEGSEWEVGDVLRHLADSERGMTALMARIREGSEGVSADFDLNRWNQRAVTKLADKSPAELMAGMDDSRAALLAFIDTLADDDWDKVGRHGSMRMMSIEQICELIADHEQTHADSIAAALATAEV